MTAEAQEWAFAALLSTPRASSNGPRGAPARCASWHLKRGLRGALEDFSPEDLRALVALVATAGSLLTDLWVSCGLDEQPETFWGALRDSFVPAGRLRSLVVNGPFSDASKSGVEPLGQLAGSLEELVLSPYNFGELGAYKAGSRLQRFPESFFALTELRSLVLIGFRLITAIPAEISSLKKLKEIDLRHCRLSSLPKVLSELSGLTKLDLEGNMNLENAPQDEAFPAELGKMKSLRVRDLKD